MVGGAGFVLALFLIISACVLMSKRGWNEWMKQLSPEKQLQSDWFSDGSLFFHEKRISLTMGNPWRGQEPLTLLQSQSCFHLPTFVSALYSHSSSPKPTMALLSATFSWTSFSQKLHRIQKRLWWDIFPPLFCGSYFLDWKSNLHATLEVLLQDYFMKWRQPILFLSWKEFLKS